MRCRTLIAAIVLAWIGIHGAPAAASETTITYQGSLTNDGAPAQGTHAMVFELFTSSVGGSALGTQSAAVEVTNGVFHVELDFGAIPWSLNNDRWLEITVEGFTLTPRQLVTRSPYALATRGIYVSNDGKVGIGRNLASEMLTITDANANILLDNDGSNFGPELILRNRAIDFTTTHGSVVFDNGSELASITYINPVLGPRGLAFSGPSSTHMKILDDGRVGIGSVDPQANLHIDGTHSPHIGFDHGRARAGDGLDPVELSSLHTGIAGRANNGLRRDIWFMDQGLGLFTRNSDDSPYPSNGVFINDTGDVGIGTIEPADKLHVVGDALIDGTAQVDVLHIVGADLAERFPTTGRGRSNPGRCWRSTRPTPAPCASRRHPAARSSRGS
jgi:hypothetical protein